MSVRIYFIALFILTNITAASDSSQWFIENKGQSYERRIGEYERISISGDVGIDINYRSKISTDNKTIVAIFDSGADTGHPAISDNIWRDPDCRSNDQTSCRGLNLIDNNYDVTDEIGHGTHIAGVIAGKKYKNTRGIAPENISVLPIKIKKNKFDSFIIRKRLLSDQFAAGIKFAVEKGAKVISMSFGLPKILETPRLKEFFKYALDRNVLIVAAAGNNGKNKPVFPCNYKHVLCVGSHDNRGKRLESSNFGHVVDIYAPGENILSLIPQNLESRIARVNGVDLKSGTSYAAPMVASLAALLYSLNPAESPLVIREFIIKFSKKINNINIVDFDKTISAYKSYLKTRETHLFSLNLKRISEQVVVGNQVKFAIDLHHLNNVHEIKVDVLDHDNNLNLALHSVEKVSSKLSRLWFISKKLDLEMSSMNSFHFDVNDRSFSVDLDLSIVARGSEKVSLNDLSLKESFQKSLHLNNSLLIPVKDYLVNSVGKEFFLKSENHGSITLIGTDENSASVRVLKFKNQTLVRSVLRVDVNLDGKLDYFIYGTDKKRSHYKFMFFNNDGAPLFKGMNEWYLKAQRFGGLNFNRGKPNFQFIKYKSSLGDILVPLVLRTHTLKDASNSRDILNRISQRSKLRPYFFQPKFDEHRTLLSIESMENYDFISNLRESLNLAYYDDITVTALVPQSRDEYLSGKVSLIYSIGENAAKKSYEVVFDSIASYKTTFITDKFLQGNNVIRHRVRSSSQFSDRLTYSKRYQRNVVRNYTVSPQRSVFINTMSWSDPISAVIDVFEDDVKQTTFLETRYNIFSHVIQNGRRIVSKYPINRESSFPGMSFSSSFKPIYHKGQPSIYMATQSVFGKSVGFLTLDNNNLVLKIKNNFSVRENCASLGAFDSRNGTMVYYHCFNENQHWIEHSTL